jgi:tetratricopeptide (TPR) repeat protein
MFTEASESLSRAIRLQPMRRRPNENSAWLVTIEQYSEAADSAKKPSVLRPITVWHTMNLGLSLFELGRPLEAIEAVKKAYDYNRISLKPTRLSVIFTTMGD